MGGGFNLSSSTVVDSYPVMSGTTPVGWTVTQSQSNKSMTVYVTCIQ